MKLLTENTGGNVHESAIYLNAAGLADYVISIEFNGGHHSVVLLRVPDNFDMRKHLLTHRSQLEAWMASKRNQ